MQVPSGWWVSQVDEGLVQRIRPVDVDESPREQILDSGRKRHIMLALASCAVLQIASRSYVPVAKDYFEIRDPRVGIG